MNSAKVFFLLVRVTKESKNALENRVFDFALVSPSEYEKG